MMRLGNMAMTGDVVGKVSIGNARFEFGGGKVSVFAEGEGSRIKFGLKEIAVLGPAN